MDEGPNLLDVRFADELCFFACSRHEREQLIDSLFVDDTCGKSSYVVECGEYCGADT